MLMVRNPKINENTTASKQTIKSCFHVSLIALRILSNNSILANKKIRVKEYNLISTKNANTDTNNNSTA